MSEISHSAAITLAPDWIYALLSERIEAATAVARWASTLARGSRTAGWSIPA
jgi:hypothetical protein